MRKAGFLILASILITHCGSTGESCRSDSALANGLRVVLRPVAGGSQVAVIVLFDIGGDHDPKGKSGLAHLTEHLYVAAAAGKTPRRDIRAFVAKYGTGWNAQTGSRYTVIATVVPTAGLAGELADAAARMASLDVVQADLDREKPRIVEELANMFGRIPHLAASNLARERVRPAPNGGRKGGRPDEVSRLMLDDVKATLARFYKPANAILVLAGGFDAAAAKPMVETHFGKIPAGERCPAPGSMPRVPSGSLEVVRAKSLQPGMQPFAAVSLRAPAPGEPSYPAFLVLVQRLISSSTKLTTLQGHFPVNYAVLDDPDILAISVPLQSGESPENAVGRVNTFVDDCVARPFGRAEAQAVKNAYGFFLGMVDLPDSAFSAEPYGLAFSIGRRLQLGMDGARVSRALDGLTAADLATAREQHFAAGNRAAAVVIPE